MRDYSFAARFGRVVLRRGVVSMPRALFTYQADLGLSPQQLWFIGYILSFQWSTELPYPSLRKMALNTGYSERQIHRIKDDLVRAGYLRVIERRGADGRNRREQRGQRKHHQRLRLQRAAADPEHIDQQARLGGRSEIIEGTAGRKAKTIVKAEIDEQERESEPENGQQNFARIVSRTGAATGAPTAPRLPAKGGEASVSGGVKPMSVGGVPDVIVGGEAYVSGGGEA